MACCGSEEEEEQPRPEPPRVRGCTDVFCLGIFILFWFLLIVIAAFAFVYGHPIRLINGYDSFGNVCGLKHNQKFGNLELSGQDTSDKPYLLYFSDQNILNTIKICVKKCPSRELKEIGDFCSFYNESGSQICHDKPDHYSICSKSVKERTGLCPKIAYATEKPKLNRCIPKDLSFATKKVVSNLYAWINNWEFLEKVLSDLYKTWREILALSFLAFVLSLFMIAIFHLLASVVTWVVMILVVIACGVGTGLLWWTYFRIKFDLNKTSEDELLVESVHNESAFLTLAIIASILTVILLFLICFIRQRLSFMAALFKESAKCLVEIPGLFFQPLLTFAALLIFFAFWVAVFLCISTANYPTTRALSKSDYEASVHYDTLNTSLLEFQLTSINQTLLNTTSLGDSKLLTIVEYKDPTWVKRTWWIYLIGLIWISEFITSCQSMIIAGAVAHWYFKGKNASASPVCASMGTLVSYHLGSVAFGSFLITIFKIPRLILMYLHEKFERTKETSPCAQCGLKCCICCFFCLEKFIRFLNHNAYTVIAIEGTNFCNGARIAFNTIVSNAVQVAVINGIGDFILFLGKVFVTAATASVGLLFMNKDERLNFFAIPLLVICIFAFFIAHCVISLYETVIDTLFLCVCEDKNLNGENGKWRESGLAQLALETNTNGQQSHELAPMNA